MSRATTHRASEVQYDGSALWTFQAAATAAATTQRFGYFVAPCDGTIVDAGYNIDTQATHATNDLSLGTVADIDSIFDEIDITSLATGFRSLMGATQGVGGLTVTKGEVYAWGWVGGDTTGHLTAYLVIEPRKSAVS